MRRTIPSIGLVLLALACLLPLVSASAQQADPGITVILPAEPNAAQVENLLKTLKDSDRPIIIRVEGAGSAAAEAPQPAAAKPAAEDTAATTLTPGNLLPWLTALKETFVAGVTLGITGLGLIDTLPGKFAEAWRGNGSGAYAFFLLLTVLLAAAAAYLAVARTGHRLVSFSSRSEPDLIARTWWRLKTLFVDIVALIAMLAAGSLVIRLALPASDFVPDLARTLMNAAFIIGSYHAIGRFLLAPDPTGSPLLPLQRHQWQLRNIAIYATAVALIIESIALLVRIDAERTAVMGWLILVTTAAALFSLWWIWQARSDVRQAIRSVNPDGLARRFVAAVFPGINLIGVILVWSAAQMTAAMPERSDWSTAASVMLLLMATSPILGFGIPALVDAAMLRNMDDETMSPARAAGRAVVRALASAGTWIVVLYSIVYIWDVYVAGGNPQDALTRMKAAAQAGLALLAGCVIWVFFRAYFDAYAPKPMGVHLAGGDDEEATTAHGRLATILPLIRDIVLGGIIALTALIILSAVGVNVGPLLAGFGVIGLAISFGSQTLIKDIVSGIFFMVDDAFRVGEYIETGSQKGTVEKIHLRSVRLRHQNGQIHTIPFGQLDAITNYSRDWSTVKFEIRLDRDADIEKARKTIKKVGQAMLEDPELGPDLIAPLKMQGIQDITDSAMVVRLKLTSKPKNPSLLQREALKRVYRALQEAGVPLASNAVVVRSPAQHGAAEAAAANAARMSPIPEPPG
ncbi:MAG: mechanosensitive ion channel family protein [Parvibaculaceae bacterium]